MKKIFFLITSGLISLISCQTARQSTELSCGEGRYPNMICKDVAQNDPLLSLPRSEKEIERVAAENTRTTTELSKLNPAFVQAVRTRADELLPKNAPVRPNYFGHDMGIVNGALTQFALDGKTSEVLIPADI